MEGKNREKHFDQNRGEIAKFPTFYAALKKKTGFDNSKQWLAFFIFSLDF